MSRNLFKPVRCAVYIWPRHVITRLGISCFRLVSSVIASLPWRQPPSPPTPSRIQKSIPIPLLHLWASVACYRVIFTFTLYTYIQMLLSSGKVSTSKFFSKCPAFKFLPRGHCSSWGCRFSIFLGVNVETIVLFEIVMWLIPSTNVPVHPLYRSLGVPQSRSIK